MHQRRAAYTSRSNRWLRLRLSSFKNSECRKKCALCYFKEPKWCTAELGRLPDRHGAWPFE